MSSYIRIQRICQHCGTEFTAQTTVTRYCSHKCSQRAYKARMKGKKIEKSNVETHRVKTQPIEELKAKPFLSIADTCKLLGINRRTVYRMIERGELITGKAGTRTILKRSDIDKLFERPTPLYNLLLNRGNMRFPNVSILRKCKRNTVFLKRRCRN